jgi:hypothetical protein
VKKLRTSLPTMMMIVPKVRMMMMPKVGIMGIVAVTRGLAMVQREQTQVTPVLGVAVTMKPDGHLLVGAIAK